uniref:Uncharacterized protein n=1 Tax=Oryza glumipatula TaxID=40148 RepID=A0A0E0AS54_9ORYZ
MPPSIPRCRHTLPQSSPHLPAYHHALALTQIEAVADLTLTLTQIRQIRWRHITSSKNKVSRILLSM